jgi:hypothetical protein
MILNGLRVCSFEINPTLTIVQTLGVVGDEAIKVDFETQL